MRLSLPTDWSQAASSSLFGRWSRCSQWSQRHWAPRSRGRGGERFDWRQNQPTGLSWGCSTWLYLCPQTAERPAVRHRQWALFGPSSSLGDSRGWFFRKIPSPESPPRQILSGPESLYQPHGLDRFSAVWPPLLLLFPVICEHGYLKWIGPAKEEHIVEIGNTKHRREMMCCCRGGASGGNLFSEKTIMRWRTLRKSQRGDSGRRSIKMNCRRAGIPATPSIHLHVPWTCSWNIQTDYKRKVFPTFGRLEAVCWLTFVKAKLMR